MKSLKTQIVLHKMLVDQLFFSNFYLHWFFSNLSFFERDPHMDSPEGIRVKTIYDGVRQSTTQLPAHQNSLMAARAISTFFLSPGTTQGQRNPEVKRFIRATPLFSQHL
jgi:hypothetical protein